MNNPNKRVCIVLAQDLVEDDETIKAGDRVMRTTRSFAEKMVSTGQWAYCSKSKLKSFLNKNAKLTRNMHTLDTMQNITGVTFNEKRHNGKVIVVVPTFKFVHDKGKFIQHQVLDVGHTVEHTVKNKAGAYKKYVQFIPNKQSFNPETGRFDFPTKTVSVKRSPWKSKNPKMMSTGDKILVVAF